VLRPQSLFSAAINIQQLKHRGRQASTQTGTGGKDREANTGTPEHSGSPEHPRTPEQPKKPETPNLTVLFCFPIADHVKNGMSV